MPLHLALAVAVLHSRKLTKQVDDEFRRALHEVLRVYELVHWQIGECQLKRSVQMHYHSKISFDLVNRHSLFALASVLALIHDEPVPSTTKHKEDKKVTYKLDEKMKSEGVQEG